MVRDSVAGNLTARDRLEFDDGTAVIVADVLADPGSFHGRTLGDSIEGPSYGMGKGKIYWNSDNSVLIHSFAHGGIVYRLNNDATYIEAELSNAGENAPFVLAKLMMHARKLDPVTRERLRGISPPRWARFRRRRSRR